MGDISKHFSRHEVECKCGCGFAAADIELVSALEDLRRKFLRPVTINSWCRCPMYNLSIGGSPGSMHAMGLAADIVVADVHADKVADYLEKKYPNKYGIGRYDRRTHVDVRTGAARWDKRNGCKPGTK